MQLRLGSSTNNFWGYSKKPFGYSRNQVSATMKLFKKLVFCSSQIGSSSQLIWLKNRFDWNHTSLTQPRFFATTWPISKTKRHKDVRSTERPWDEQGFWCLKYWKWKMCTKTRCHGNQTLGRITNFCWFEIIGWFNSLESWHDWHVFFDRLVFFKVVLVIHWGPILISCTVASACSARASFIQEILMIGTCEKPTQTSGKQTTHIRTAAEYIGIIHHPGFLWNKGLLTKLTFPFGTMEVQLSWFALGIAM